MNSARFELKYEGHNADDRVLDFYDASVALIGFQRSLAITTHAVLNGEVITQAPALRGARIWVTAPEPGSWKVVTIVVAAGTALFSLGTAPKDTPIGNLVSSAYDYVISESLGFHVDYNKTLQEQYEEVHRDGHKIKPLSEQRLQSVIEKCEVPIRDMHRPIVKSETAVKALIVGEISGKKLPIGAELNSETYDYILSKRPPTDEIVLIGRVSMYNTNTFKGRVFVESAERPIPFEIPEEFRSPQLIVSVARSLAENARSRQSTAGIIRFIARKIESRTGRIVGLWVLGVIDDLRESS